MLYFRPDAMRFALRLFDESELARIAAEAAHAGCGTRWGEDMIRMAGARNAALERAENAEAALAEERQHLVEGRSAFEEIDRELRAERAKREAAEKIAALSEAVARAIRISEEREGRDVDALFAQMAGAETMKERAERAEARSLAAERELERFRHGATIEGDFVCPNALRVVNAETALDEERAKREVATVVPADFEGMFRVERERAEKAEVLVAELQALVDAVRSGVIDGDIEIRRFRIAGLPVVLGSDAVYAYVDADGRWRVGFLTGPNHTKVFEPRSFVAAVALARELAAKKEGAG